jgi:flagellar protein FlgJ
MNTIADISNQFSLDTNALGALKREAREDPKAALQGAAKQFEALFLNMVLKSMRDASPQDGLFDNEQTRLYQSMLDQQLAQTLSARGATGLAAMLEKQLGRNLIRPGDDAQSGADSLAPKSAAADSAPDSRFRLDTLRGAGRQLVNEDSNTKQAAAAASAPQPASTSVRDGGTEFVNRMWPHAHEASRATGIPAHFILAQAALETGWGRSEIRHADGRPSFNLFNIKAGGAWSGATVEVLTTEYANGVPQKQTDRFRAYGSYADAFADYARLLRGSPRYAGVLGQNDAAGFARALQQAGYATDPMYAAKLERIISGPLLRQRLMT